MQQVDKVVTAASPDDRAEGGKIAALPPREASTTLPQTGSLAQLHAINKLDLTNLQPPEVSLIVTMARVQRFACMCSLFIPRNPNHSSLHELHTSVSRYPDVLAQLTSHHIQLMEPQ